MKKKTIKLILLFFVSVSLAFSFPIQVMVLNPIPALLPYFFMVLLFSLSLNSSASNSFLLWSPRRPIIFVLSIYLSLVLFQTVWQVFFGFISIYNAISTLVIFLFPVLFFVYFRTATNQEIRVFLYTISIIGLVVGAYYVYDSFSMLVLNQLNDYSLKAFEYSQFRGAPGQNISDARISVGNRSHGLLENHSINSAWIVLGCLSALTLLPKSKFIKRTIVIFIYGVLLLIGLNFTAIIGFAFVIFLMEFRGYILLRGAIPKKIILFLLMIICVFTFFSFVHFLFPNSMSERMYVAINSSLVEQIGIASGSTQIGNSSYFGRMISAFYSFPYNMRDFPLGVLIGDGFSAFGSPKGGDYGIVETLHRFGLPMFFTIIIGLIMLIRRALKQIKYRLYDSAPEASYLWFATSVIIYLLFTEIHYTVWCVKSILPILFISLAICDRYLYSPRLVSTTISSPSSGLSTTSSTIELNKYLLS
jgi:hypothetical protein